MQLAFENGASLEEERYPDDPSAVRSFFDREGYIVARGLVPPDRCDAVRRAFERQAKPSRAKFFRHESGSAERHVFTPEGFMKYPIMNPHALSPLRFGALRDNALRTLTDPALRRYLTALLGQRPKVIHSMYFEGNQVTWAHPDSYYVDSTEIGKMVGLWIALEDIHAGAGRFYVCPRSHRLAWPKLGEGFDLDPNSREFRAWVRERVDGMEYKAPALRKGDVVFFSSLTVHGSLETTAQAHSRSSLTAHVIPESHRFCWAHQREPKVSYRDVNGVPVCFDAVQSRLRQRLEAFARVLHGRS